MHTFLILLVIVFTFCGSIGLMIYDKDIDPSVTDDVSSIFDDTKDDIDDEII